MDISCLETLMSLKGKYQLQVFAFSPVIQEPIVSDLLEAAGQHMHQITADELCVLQGDGPARLARLPSSGGKRDLLVIYRNEAAVSDSYFVGISPKIFHRISEAVEGFFDVRAPVFFIKAIAKPGPFVRIPQLFTGRGKYQLAAFIKGIQFSKIFPPEFVPEDLYRDEKMIDGFTDPMVRCKPAAGNNTMHMHMIEHFLIPGMDDLYDTGCCAEVLFARREFQKGPGAASVEQSIEELLVTVDKAVQLMGKSKDDMEIRRIYHFSPPLIHPDFLIHSLAVGAVAVAAGIVMEFGMPAVGALGNVDAKGTGFTAHDGTGCFFLDIRLEAAGRAKCFIGKLPDLLDLRPVHGKHLPSGQKGLLHFPCH